jgi:hypothetical protein
MGILDKLLKVKCEHSKECKHYQEDSPSCNDDYVTEYCGLSRGWDEDHL